LVFINGEARLSKKRERNYYAEHQYFEDEEEALG